MRNQEYEYAHRWSVQSICWNLCTDFVNVNKFGAFSAFLDKENSNIFRGKGGGGACLWRSIGQNGENVLISDFQMLASMSLVYRAVHLGIPSSSLVYRAVHLGIPSSSLVYRAVHLGITSSCSVISTVIKCKR